MTNPKQMLPVRRIVSNDMIGRYVSQGYENPSFGFAIALPDTYTLEKRTNLELNADTIEIAPMIG